MLATETKKKSPAKRNPPKENIINKTSNIKKKGRHMESMRNTKKNAEKCALK